MAGTEYDGNLESEWRVLDLADVREGWEAGARSDGSVTANQYSLTLITLPLRKVTKIILCGRSP